MLKKWTSMFLLVASILFIVNAEASTWERVALALQHEIDNDLPLNEAVFIGTHNSYNAKAYQTFLRYLDPNQNLSLYDQLEAGVRSLELDAHWSLQTNFSKEILLCHGLDNHIGCNLTDRPFVEGLKEIRDWLNLHPGTVILLYIERHLDGHEPRLAAQLEAYLGQYIFKANQFRHSNNECVALPTFLTKADILKAGKQLIVVSKACEPGKAALAETDQFNTQWTDYIFTGIGTIPTLSYTFIDMTISHFTGYPDCGKNTPFQVDINHESMWRVYEDRSQLSGVIYPERKLLPKDMGELVACGINWPTVDFLEKEDDRLKTAIWSWAQHNPQPNGGRCAFYQSGEGIKNTACATLLPGYFCKEDKTHAINLISLPGSFTNGESACQLLGAAWHFSLPQTGPQMQTLKRSLTQSNLQQVWLNYAINRDNRWQANMLSRI